MLMLPYSSPHRQSSREDPSARPSLYASRSVSYTHLVKVTKENTTIVDGAGDSQASKDRVGQIRTQISTKMCIRDRVYTIRVERRTLGHAAP